MEMTFYDDNMFRKNDSKSLKRPVTLDLDSSETLSKKQKFSAILTSPDLNMLKLASPELERFIISNGNITTTPTPTQFLFSKNVTEEQEQYARGFIDALNQLHQHQAFEITGGNGLRITTPVTSGNGLIGRIATPVTSSNGLIGRITTPVSEMSPSKLYPGILPFYMQSPTTSVIKSSKTFRAVEDAPVKTSTIYDIRRPSSVDSAKSSGHPDRDDSGRQSENKSDFDISKYLGKSKFSDSRQDISFDISRHLALMSSTKDRCPSAKSSDSSRLSVVRPPSADSSLSSSSMIKEELQTVPSDFSTPPMSPIGRIDMADQERIKLERKRHRNRIAASKCRQRKLEKISTLEDKVKDLKDENTKLETVVDKLRDQVCALKAQVLEHVKKGCQIMITHNL